MIRAVTLDFWNTLFEDHRAEKRRRIRAEGVRVALAPFAPRPADDEIERAFQASWDHFDDVWRHEQRTPSTAESMRVVLGRLDVTVPEDVFAHLVDTIETILLEAPPRPIEGVTETLPRLAGRYRLAVVCDAGLSPGRTLRRVLELHDLTRHFGALFFSDEHGVSKPQARAFEIPLRELGVDAADSVHIGDIQRTDIAGAHAAGLRAVHFVGINAADMPRSTAEAILYRFADLPDVLERLG